MSSLKDQLVADEAANELQLHSQQEHQQQVVDDKRQKQADIPPDKRIV